MVNRRQTMLALAAVAAAPLACTRRSHGANTVRFWAVGREGEYAVDLLQDFLRERPDIEVEVQKLPWNGAHEKLLTAYAGDSVIDASGGESAHPLEGSSDPDLWLMRDCLFDSAGKETALFWEAATATGNHGGAGTARRRQATNAAGSSSQLPCSMAKPSR